MGQHPTTATTPLDQAGLAARSQREFAALRSLAPRLNRCDRRIGAEGEIQLYSRHTGGPLHHANGHILEELDDHSLVAELGGWQVEENYKPQDLDDPTGDSRPFSAALLEGTVRLNRVRRLAQEQGGDAVLVGILPTLRPGDLTMCTVSRNRPRYNLLNQGLWPDGTAPHLHQLWTPSGPPLEVHVDSVAKEAAITSGQGHWLPLAGQFVSDYNVSLATGPAVLAIAANSSIMYGHPVALDARAEIFATATRYIAELNHGYITNQFGPIQRVVNSSRPAIMPPGSAEEDAAAMVRAGQVPSLEALRLLIGTDWPFLSRAIYGPDPDDPHLRIETRELPAGPTLLQFWAHLALRFGLIANQTLAEIPAQLPFSLVAANFWAACRYGPKANLWWPNANGQPVRVNACELILSELIPAAHTGLVSAGVAPDEANRFLNPIRRNAEARISGGLWQSRRLQQLLADGRYDRDAASLRVLVEYADYTGHGTSHDLVCDWPAA
jgi:hypothetical protein